MSCSRPADQQISADPGVCAACAKTGTTCCFIVPENAELCFPLSSAEADCLRAHLGSGFHSEEAPNSLEFLTIMYSLFPGESTTINTLFPAGEKHFTLATTYEGFCIHLGSQGCMLSRKIRPWFCKLFPFWIIQGKLTGFSAPYCLAARQTITVRGMLKKITQPEAELLEIYNCLRRDWGFVPFIPGVEPD